MGVGEARCLLKTNCHFSNIFMLIILLLAFSNMATHLRLQSAGVCLSCLYWFSLLGSYFLSFCHSLYAQDLAARRGSSVGHTRGRLRFRFFFFFLLSSEDRKPNDFQHSVRLTKSFNIPSSQCNEVEPVPAVEG